MLGRLLVVKVWRGEGGGLSDRFLVESLLKLVAAWMGECREDGGCDKCFKCE